MDNSRRRCGITGKDVLRRYGAPCEIRPLDRPLLRAGLDVTGAGAFLVAAGTPACSTSAPGTVPRVRNRRTARREVALLPVAFQVVRPDGWKSKTLADHRTAEICGEKFAMKRQFGPCGGSCGGPW